MHSTTENLSLTAAISTVSWFLVDPEAGTFMALFHTFVVAAEYMGNTIKNLKRKWKRLRSQNVHVCERRDIIRLQERDTVRLHKRRGTSTEIKRHGTFVSLHCPILTSLLLQIKGIFLYTAWEQCTLLAFYRNFCCTCIKIMVHQTTRGSPSYFTKYKVMGPAKTNNTVYTGHSSFACRMNSYQQSTNAITHINSHQLHQCHYPH